MSITSCLVIGISGTVTIISILCGLCFWLEKVTEKLHKKIVGIETEDCTPFIVSEYLSRIEQEHVKILDERDKEPAYIITLWLGLDGLRMNEDGTFEWVSRKMKTITFYTYGTENSEFRESDIIEKTFPVPSPIYHPVPTPTYLAGCPQYYYSTCCPTYTPPYQKPLFPMPWMNQSMQSQIQELKQRELELRINMGIQQQTQQIQQSIQTQTAQIENNMRLIEMLNSQQNCNRITQLHLDSQQQM